MVRIGNGRLGGTLNNDDDGNDDSDDYPVANPATVANGTLRLLGDDSLSQPWVLFRRASHVAKSYSIRFEEPARAGPLGIHFRSTPLHSNKLESVDSELGGIWVDSIDVGSRAHTAGIVEGARLVGVNQQDVEKL